MNFIRVPTWLAWMLASCLTLFSGGLAAELIRKPANLCGDKNAVQCHQEAMKSLQQAAVILKSAREVLAGNCRAGHAPSCLNLANSYLQSGDSDSGQGFIKKACELGETAACPKLNTSYKDANAAKEVIRVLKHTCKSGNHRACINLASIYENLKNFKEAEEIFRQVCRIGVMDGCPAYGQMELRRGNQARALEIFNVACNAGKKITCLWSNEIQHKAKPPK